jgi:hypothetical protein
MTHILAAILKVCLWLAAGVALYVVVGSVVGLIIWALITISWRPK